MYVAPSRRPHIRTALPERGAGGGHELRRETESGQMGDARAQFFLPSCHLFIFHLSGEISFIDNRIRALESPANQRHTLSVSAAPPAGCRPSQMWHPLAGTTGGSRPGNAWVMLLLHRCRRHRHTRPHRTARRGISNRNLCTGAPSSQWCAGHVDSPTKRPGQRQHRRDTR